MWERTGRSSGKDSRDETGCVCKGKQRGESGMMYQQQHRAAEDTVQEGKEVEVGLW
jgi:hypothetical protein